MHLDLAKRFLLLFLLSCPLIRVWAQTKHTISGSVRSKATGESVIRATVAVSGMNIGVTTNDYGFYSLTLPDGKYMLVISAVGRQNETVEVDLKENMQLSTLLKEQGVQLQDVTVTAAVRGRSLRSAQMGVEHITTKEIKSVPALFGEQDVLKTLQFLPGVNAAAEGNSGLNVRGGSTDQNLILLDEAPVYNAYHLLGFFSTFNPDAVKDVTLYKGDMPAQYGGRLSSVVDVRMNEGNNQETHVTGGVGLISAKLDVEGPIEKDKSSFLFTARRTYLDAFLRLSKDSTVNKNSLYFYDLNGKLNFTLSDRDRLYISGYYGKDDMSSADIFGLSWGNTTATVRWNHTFGPRLFSNTSLIYSNYNYDIAFFNGGNFTVNSVLRDFNLKEEFQYYLNPRNTIRFGINSIDHRLSPGVVNGNNGNSEINDTSFQVRYGWENAVYLSNDWKASNRLNISYGFRGELFSAFGKGNYYNVDPAGTIIDTLHNTNGGIIKTYFNPEFRLAFSYQVDPTTSIKASYAGNTQNIHLLSPGSIGNPTDRYVLSNNMIRPETSDQVSLGYYKNLRDDKYELTVETYYKALNHQIDYRDGADLHTNDHIETELLYGKGRAYGIEWLLRKKTGRLTGWIGYTLSKTERKIDGINDDQWYNATQDRTHDISIVAMYKLNQKWNLSANWVYYTGNPISLPSGKYKADGRTIYYYSERNGYRMPSYHRLDLSAAVQLKQRRKFSSELAFGVYNAYARNNAYLITFRDNPDNPNQTQALQTTLFSIVPFVSYNFKF
jgi:hypothetical protein